MSPLDITLIRLEEQDMNMYDEDAGFDVAVYLVNRGCGSDEKLLCAACKHGKLDVVKELVEQHQVDPNSEIIVALLYRIAGKFGVELNLTLWRSGSGLSLYSP